MATPRKPESEKRLCGAKKTDGSGKTCTQPAGWGTPHPGWGKCKWHGGSTSALQTAAAREEAAAMVEKIRMLTPVNISPEDALLGEVQRSASVVSFFDQLVGQEVDDNDGDLLMITVEGWKPRAFIEVWTKQREHLAKVCKMALDAGVAERQVRLAEKQGELVAGVIKAIFKDLDLSPEQKQIAPAVARKHLLMLNAG